MSNNNIKREKKKFKPTLSALKFLKKHSRELYLVYEGLGLSISLPTIS